MTKNAAYMFFGGSKDDSLERTLSSLLFGLDEDTAAIKSSFEAA
ncbi:MAG: hypothetical protein WCC06_13805 [Candidatus Aminicenantales bacterium]